MNKILPMALVAISIGFATSANAIPQKIATGIWHTIYVDGTEAYGMGRADLGMLGEASSANINSLPIQLGISDVKYVAAGRHTSVFLKNDGTAVYTGANLSTRARVFAPELVPGVNITDIAAGTSNIVFVSDGRVYNWNMLVGDAPVDMGLFNIVEVSAGADFNMAKDINGNVYTWGDGPNGELGNGVFGSSATPSVVASGVHYMHAGKDAAAAVFTDGSSQMWGNNNNGKLGDESYVAQPSPVDINTDLSFSKVVTGGIASFGIEANSGDLYGWGWHNYIGGTTWNRSSLPIRIADITDVREISAYYGHYVLLTNAGDIYSWGGDNNGKLGDSAEIKETHGPVYVTSVSIVDQNPIICPGPIEVIVEVPGENIYIDVPGETVYVEVETIVEVEQIVEVPIETIVQVPVEVIVEKTVEVPIDISSMSRQDLKLLKKQISKLLKRNHEHDRGHGNNEGCDENNPGKSCKHNRSTSKGKKVKN